jgi:hypothetical protein
MDTMYQRSKLQEESLFYEQKKHDGSLPLIGVNTFLPREHAGETATTIELIRSTDEEKAQQIANVEAYRQLRTLIGNPTYQNLPDEKKAQLIRNAVSGSRKGAKTQLLLQGEVPETPEGKPISGIPGVAKAAAAAPGGIAETGTQLVGDQLFYLTDEGDLKKVELGAILAMPEGTAFERAEKSKEQFGAAAKLIASEIPDQNVDEALGKLGIPREDAEYYRYATIQDTQLKTAAVEDFLPGMPEGGNPVAFLTSLRREVGGKMLLTSGVIDELVDRDTISRDQGKYLKRITHGKDGVVRVKAGGRGRKPKVRLGVGAPRASVPKIRGTGRRTGRVRFAAPQVKLPAVGKLRTKQVGRQPTVEEFRRRLLR